MRVLALDTTGRAGSVALIEDDVILEERAGDSSRTHAERLPGELLALLERCGVPLTAIDLFGVAAGPGSFTGIRIGIATMQGLAFVTGRPIVAVSALDALGHAAARGLPPGAPVAAWIDAQRGEVFSALYEVAAGDPFTDNRLTPIVPPAVASPADTLAGWPAHDARSALFIGDGAVRYADAIAATFPGTAHVAALPLLAGAIGRLAADAAAHGRAKHPAAIRPIYIRRPDAEIDRARREAALRAGRS